ncbi:MAG: 1-(5-phosphoribosyl)-5-[(5-phosphoribosylamino)methylideneamino]imidazole-4-carboxamide isomerase [Clostridia bacterium]|nr:1-(5-phosphoribosyl)-5-[(5-phosphoribosylamino)methylideneamino]imidazole-4-carboxamide isomerase [Clostridia bacterium]
MKIFPAIDLYEGKAVRLYKGDYAQMTVYSENPVEVALDFKAQGAEWIHLVDLEGARDGDTPNLETVRRIVKESGLCAEVGGGIRSIEVIEKYLAAGVKRVILGTAAVTDPAFLSEAVSRFGESIAVGVDIKDGYVAIKGWQETSSLEGMAFCRRLEKLGVRTVICTDISKDGAMQGTNHALYDAMRAELGMQIIASGGVSDISDVKRLAAANMYGAIIGKAYYTKAISLKEAIEVAK